MKITKVSNSPKSDSDKPNGSEVFSDITLLNTTSASFDFLKNVLDDYCRDDIKEAYEKRKFK